LAERHRRRHAHGPIAPAVPRPALRHVELIGDRQAHRLIGHRHAHRHLAVVLFAEDATVLPGDAHRVLPFLGERRVVHDPRGHGAVPGHRRQHLLPRDAQHGRRVPGGVGDKMMHRLMPGADMPGIHARRHRLDALALPGQAQARDVGAQRLMAIPVAEHGGQAVHIGGEALGTGRLGGRHTSRLAGYPMNSLAFLT